MSLSKPGYGIGSAGGPWEFNFSVADHRKKRQRESPAVFF
jgi:hypothetical protein